MGSSNFDNKSFVILVIRDRPHFLWGILSIFGSQTIIIWTAFLLMYICSRSWGGFWKLWGGPCYTLKANLTQTATYQHGWKAYTVNHRLSGNLVIWTEFPGTEHLLWEIPSFFRNLIPDPELNFLDKYAKHACTVLFTIFKYPLIHYPEEISKVTKVPDKRGLTLYQSQMRKKILVKQGELSSCIKCRITGTVHAVKKDSTGTPKGGVAVR